jgi:hypothetical protein
MEKIKSNNIIVEMADELYNEGNADIAYRLLRKWVFVEQELDESEDSVWAASVSGKGYSYVELIRLYKNHFNCQLREAKENVNILMSQGKLPRYTFLQN